MALVHNGVVREMAFKRNAHSFDYPNKNKILYCDSTYQTTLFLLKQRFLYFFGLYHNLYPEKDEILAKNHSENFDLSGYLPVYSGNAVYCKSSTNKYRNKHFHKGSKFALHFDSNMLIKRNVIIKDSSYLNNSHSLARIRKRFFKYPVSSYEPVFSDFGDSTLYYPKSKAYLRIKPTLHKAFHYFWILDFDFVKKNKLVVNRVMESVKFSFEHSGRVDTIQLVQMASAIDTTFKRVRYLKDYTEENFLNCDRLFHLLGRKKITNSLTKESFTEYINYIKYCEEMTKEERYNLLFELKHPSVDL